MQRVRAGDEAAARALFERYAPLFQDQLRRALPDRLRAKVAVSDILQEAWLRAFRSLGSFPGEGEADFERWLHCIVTHRLVDEIRWFTTDRRNARREVAGGDQVQDHDPSASARLTSAEERAALWRAIEELPPELLLVVRLRLEGRMPFAEIGRLTGVSGEAARKAHARAVRLLAERLGEGRGDDHGRPVA